MATVGQQLTAPEAGWKRYDDTDKNISYSGTGWDNDATYAIYGTSRRRNAAMAKTPDYSIRFNFTGSNLRIIGVLSTNWSDNLQISIDGIVESFSQHANVVIGEVLNYQKLNLNNDEHSVVITNIGDGYWGLDAIDIDETGKIIPYVPPKNKLLRVTMLDSSEREYRLSDEEVEGFVNWYNHHVSTDTMSYAINDSVDRSKEYLSFDKIISFKVIPTVE